MLAILSDTHGLLRPAVVEQLQGVAQILHAGDVGSAAVLDQMHAIAPLTAVRGNVDRASWADRLPLSASLVVAGVGFHLVHNIADLPAHPAPPGTEVVVFGHSHKPDVFRRGDTWFLNAGSAGPRRFSLPVSLVLVRPGPDGWHFSFIDLTAQI